jgi:hypothetical protein
VLGTLGSAAEGPALPALSCRCFSTVGVPTAGPSGGVDWFAEPMRGVVARLPAIEHTVAQLAITQL